VLVPVTFASSSTTTCHSIMVRPSHGVKKHLRAQNTSLMTGILQPLKADIVLCCPGLDTRNPARGRVPVSGTVMSINTSADQRSGAWDRSAVVVVDHAQVHTDLLRRVKYQIAAAAMITSRMIHQ
jgi:hypothetical protein